MESATDAILWASPARMLAQNYSQSSISADRMEAIRLYNLLFDVYTRETNPMEWASLMKEYGVLFKDMGSGNTCFNEDTACRSLNAALTVYNKEENPDEWGICMYFLGILYANSKTLSLPDINEDAIGCLECSLEVLNRDAEPSLFAYICNELSCLYLHRREGNPAENIELSIDYARKGIAGTEDSSDPYDRLNTRLNLAYSLIRRLKGEPSDNIKEAIEVFCVMENIAVEGKVGDDYLLLLQFDAAQTNDRLYRLKKDTDSRDKTEQAFMKAFGTLKRHFAKTPSSEERKRLINDSPWIINSALEFLTVGHDWEFKTNFLRKAGLEYFAGRINLDDFMPRKRTSANMKGFWEFSALVKEIKTDSSGSETRSAKPGKEPAENLLYLKRKKFSDSARQEAKTKPEDMPETAASEKASAPNPAPSAL